MHDTLAAYLTARAASSAAVLTIKADRSALNGFARWWEATQRRPFDPALVVARDAAAWQRHCQVEDGKSARTINGAARALKGCFTWAKEQGLLNENPFADLPRLTEQETGPRAIPKEAVDALLRALQQEGDERLRLRDSAALAVLIYAGLRVQELCDLQLRDLDLAGLTVTVRRGKRGRSRRVPLHRDAATVLKSYLTRLRCVDGLPPFGSAAEREALLVNFDPTISGRPATPGVDQRTIQRRLKHYAAAAAARLRADMPRVSLDRAGELDDLARKLERATPHTLRHSLARRMLGSGADLAEVMRVLGHSRITTTQMYAEPSEDEVREAIGRAGI
jgi:site-specific recombinase XerD